MIAALALAAAVAVPNRPQTFVTDTAGVLRSATVQSVRDELQTYYTKTGNTVYVWIGDTTGGEPLEQWTIAAASKWKVGRKGKDDGAILFLFMRDHKVRIEVGYGLESVLTDAQSSRIIRDDIIPRMRANDPDGAVQTGVNAIVRTISPGYALPANDVEGTVPYHQTIPDDDAAAIGWIVIIVAFGLFVLFAFGRTGRKGRWYSSSGYRGGTGGIFGASLGGGFGGGGFGGGSFGGGGFGGGFGGGGASGGW